MRHSFATHMLDAWALHFTLLDAHIARADGRGLRSTYPSEGLESRNAKKR